jgi:glycine cleavage system T protein (aminomethyltransferase)
MALADFNLIGDFGDAAAEARACRTDCALFDFSFLECARLYGVGAKGIIEGFTGRRLDSLGIGNIYYALRVGPAGNILADLTIWRTGLNSYEVMSGRREDVHNLINCAGPGVDVSDLGPEMATFALQGPRSLDVLRHLGPTDLIGRLDYFTFADTALDGLPCRIGRLGYTGEAGFEIIFNRRHTDRLWQTLSAHARPVGFIAADMLRIEAGFVLFTNDFLVPVSPVEAGLGRFHRRPEAATPELALISFCATSGPLHLPWKPSSAVQRPASVGEITVTSACYSLAAGGVLGLGYAHANCAIGACLHDPTGNFRNIRRVGMPFHDPAKLRPRGPWPHF